jgi:hypothetical protein
LESFAQREKTTAVEVDDLRAFLERQAIPGEPHFSLPLIRTELDALCEAGRVRAENREGQTVVFLPELCRRHIEPHYGSIAEMKENPFPNEQTLGVKIPGEFTLNLLIDTDFPTYLAGDCRDENAVVRLISPDGDTLAFLTPDMIPQKLTEACLYKLSFYLGDKNVKYYLYQKLLPQFKGKESFAGNMLDQIQETPLKCYDGIASGDEASYHFWAILCDFIKRDLGEEGSHASRETSAARASLILTPIVMMFREKTARQAKKEKAFKDILEALKEPPYFYNHENILSFKDEDGEKFVDQCGLEAFEDWFTKQQIQSGETLPPILSFLAYDGTRLYVAKERFLLMIAQKVLETRGSVRYIIIQRWRRILRDYQTEKAMEDDVAFDDLIHRIVRRRNHVLASLLVDNRLALAHIETAKNKENIPGIKVLFNSEGLNPAPIVFALNRHELLRETKSGLPLRYTNPYLRAIFMFFAKLKGKKHDEGEPELEEETENLKAESSRETALHLLEAALIPEEYSLDSYLDALEGRWNQLADDRTRRASRRAVDALVRNRVLGILGSHKRRVLSMEEITSTASDIVDFSPTFQKIPGKKALKSYAEVFIIKVMRTLR